MKKEASRQVPGTLFEGMTSVRSVLRAMEDGISDRKILRLLAAEERRDARAKELSWLGRMAEKHGFPVEYVPESELDISQKSEQLSLFSAQPEQDKGKQRERDIQLAILRLRKRYGKNAVLKGMNFKEGATAIERNRQIGGHRA